MKAHQFSHHLEEISHRSKSLILCINVGFRKAPNVDLEEDPRGFPMQHCQSHVKHPVWRSGGRTVMANTFRVWLNTCTLVTS